MESGTLRYGVIGGITLTTLGGLLLLQPLTGINLWAFIWPYFVIAPGLLCLFVAVRRLPGLAIPGSLLTATGLILFYQNTFSYFQSWAYAWALLCPATIGVGLVIQGRLSQNRQLVLVGRSLGGGGLLLFLALATSFEVGVFNHGSVVRFGLPLLLIVAGLVVSAGSLAQAYSRRVWIES